MAANGLDNLDRFKAAVAIANIPALLMVLVHMTGDTKWLKAPYRPSRPKGMGDNDSGGLPDAIQTEIRAAALEAIVAWKGGTPLALPEPDEALALEMLSAAVGEDIPPDYYGIIDVELREPWAPPRKPEKVKADFEVIIIGAGVSGLCLAYHLKRAGIPFRILEKNHSVGGTWKDNRYPGAGVDTPNHLYSFSFAPYDWTKFFALRDELQEYLEHIADSFGLLPHIEFGVEVTDAKFDKSSNEWVLDTIDEQKGKVTTRAPVLVSAIGIFNPLVRPDIPGLDEFQGQTFHTAEWPEEIDLKGKRVAIVGNGASAMQICPEILGEVENLTIFQKSQHWVVPHPHFREKIPDDMRFLLKEVPLYRIWYRLRLGWTFGDRLYPALQKDPNWIYSERSLNAQNDGHRKAFTDYIRAELGDRQDLFEQVLPTYPPFGKRMLMDNGWYRMLRHEKVTLVSDPIVQIGAQYLETNNGTQFDADVIVQATGFDVLRFVTTFNAVGRSGKSLRESWEDIDAKAYLGTSIPDFPNFFALYGPNLQSGHGGSYMFMAEMQTRFVMDLIIKMLDNDLAWFECDREICERYNDRVDAAHEKMVWTHPGMETYYRNEKGRVVVNSPFLNSEFYRMSKEANLSEFRTASEVNSDVS